MAQRRITPDAEKVYRKYGTAPLMHLTDDSTGEVLYTDRDVADLAKWSASRGGPAANDNLPSWTAVNDFIEKNFQILYKCTGCGVSQHFFPQSIYDGQTFADGSKGIRCSHCWVDNPVLEMPADKKEEYEFKYPWIDKLIDVSINNMEGKLKVIEEFVLAEKAWKESK